MRIKLKKKALDKAYKIVAKAIECWANFYFKLRTSLKAVKKKRRKKDSTSILVKCMFVLRKILNW